MSDTVQHLQTQQVVEPAIHDIGYQRYSGPRLGRRSIWWALYVDVLRGSFGFGRSAGAKVWPWLLLAITTLPTVIVIVIASLTNATTLAVSPAQWTAQVLPIVDLYVGILTPRAVSRDLRFRTVPLYLSRPLTRGDYISAKALSMATAVFVLLATPVTVLALGGLLAELPWRDQLESWGLGLVVAFEASVLFALVGLAISAWTPRRGLATAAVLGFFVVSSGIAGVVTGLLQAQNGDTSAAYAFALSPWTLASGLGLWIEQTPGGPGGETIPTGPGLVFVGTWVVSVVLAYAILVLRYRRVSAS